MHFTSMHLYRFPLSDHAFVLLVKQCTNQALGESRRKLDGQNRVAKWITLQQLFEWRYDHHIHGDASRRIEPTPLTDHAADKLMHIMRKVQIFADRVVQRERSGNNGQVNHSNNWMADVRGAQKAAQVLLATFADSKSGGLVTSTYEQVRRTDEKITGSIHYDSPDNKSDFNKSANDNDTKQTSHLKRQDKPRNSHVHSSSRRCRNRRGS